MIIREEDVIIIIIITYKRGKNAEKARKDLNTHTGARLTTLQIAMQILHAVALSRSHHAL